MSPNAALFGIVLEGIEHIIIPLPRFCQLFLRFEASVGLPILGLVKLSCPTHDLETKIDS